ncbi:hypothetical protein T484DRAFT_1843479, partial [Baffinella frigidus]
VFTTQLLAVVLQQLLDQTPLPQLYMRTVLLCLKLAPALTDFAMGILQRLISKQLTDFTMGILQRLISKKMRTRAIVGI